MYLFILFIRPPSHSLIIHITFLFIYSIIYYVYVYFIYLLSFRHLDQFDYLY